jgi:wyosine [tRNA(Phe)-imidazoG37] synthetase (radical SAM superfamily)
MPGREHKYVFGPVPSRRLGRSLGVDLMPFKTCTYDCIYCQLGRTTRKTLQRAEYVPIGDVLSEVRRALSEGPRPDYVTLSGSGEPTLHSRLQELISGIKSLTPVPLAVLTNGSLLSEEGVRHGPDGADVVIPSLDAGDDELFHRVNRPHGDLSFSRMVEGLLWFRRDFSKQIWLEVFLLAGVTDTAAEVEKIARLARQTRPDRIQLNTVDRPPAERSALPVPRDTLERLAGLFNPRAEVIAEFKAPSLARAKHGAAKDILALLVRRPCTVEHMAEGLGMRAAEVVKWLAPLEASGMVDIVYQGNRRFYVAAGDRDPAGRPEQ